MFKTIKNKKKIHIETPSPLNLEYRKKVSSLKDDYTINYLNKFAEDMEYRAKTKIIDMMDDDLTLFAVKFLGEDKQYQYYYIYENETIIGEIYAYSYFNKKDYFFFIYISEEYRTPENFKNAILEFEEEMYNPFINARRLYIDTDFLNLDDVLIKSNFKLDAIFYNDKKRYICKEYMYHGMYLESPTIEHEEKFKRYLKNNAYNNYNIFNYKKWLKRIEKESKNKKEYFLMFYNSDINDVEIVGVGYVLNNWKKTNCIEYEIEKTRKQTDFGKYFLEMLFDELDENAEFITLTCRNNEVEKIKEYEEVFADVIDNVYEKKGKIYFKLTLIVY